VLGKGPPTKVNVRFGSEADVCNAHTYVRFGPIADMFARAYQRIVDCKLE